MRSKTSSIALLDAGEALIGVRMLRVVSLGIRLRYCDFVNVAGYPRHNDLVSIADMLFV